MARPDNIIARSIVRHTDGRNVHYYRAEMTDRWKPSYVGASRVTRYFTRHEMDPRGSWRQIESHQVPRSAMKKLRASLLGEVAPKRDVEPVWIVTDEERGGREIKRYRSRDDARNDAAERNRRAGHMRFAYAPEYGLSETYAQMDHSRHRRHR